LDEVALITNLDVVRLTLRVLGATIWVGGQIALLALVEPLRRTAPAAVARSPRLCLGGLACVRTIGRHGRVADRRCRQAKRCVPDHLDAQDGVRRTFRSWRRTARLRQDPFLKDISATVALLSALCAVLLGVSIVEAP
jgi:hypothetical protein